MSLSPEMETLDQLLGGEMRLNIVRRLYDSDQSFTRGILSLLQAGDVRLLDDAHAEVPNWRRRALFDDGEVLSALHSFTLEVTAAGAAKVS